MILYSANANKKTFKTSVQPGWYYSGRKMVRFCMYNFILDLNNIVNVDWFISVALQDTADVEWMMWFSTFRVHIIFALSGHVIFAKICSLLAPQVALESPDTSVLHVTHYWLNLSLHTANLRGSFSHFFPIPQYRSLVFMVYGMLAVFCSMGWAYVMLILSHCVLLYSISLVKLRWLCFVAGLTTLATFKMEPFISWQACHWHCKNIKYKNVNSDTEKL